MQVLCPNGGIFTAFYSAGSRGGWEKLIGRTGNEWPLTFRRPISWMDFRHGTFIRRQIFPKVERPLRSSTRNLFITLHFVSATVWRYPNERPLAAIIFFGNVTTSLHLHVPVWKRNRIPAHGFVFSFTEQMGSNWKIMAGYGHRIPWNSWSSVELSLANRSHLLYQPLEHCHYLPAEKLLLTYVASSSLIHLQNWKLILIEFRWSG